MRYTHFEISNFKGIRHAVLDLENLGPDARIFTLVGLNESGKTTVLEAIDHFTPTTEGGSDVSPKQLAGWRPPDPHELVPISERRNFNDNISIECGVELSDADFEEIRRKLLKEHDYRLKDLARRITIEDRYTYEASQFENKRTYWSGLRGNGRAKTQRNDRKLSSPMPVWVETTKIIRSLLPPIWYFPNFLFDFPERIYVQPIENESDTNRFYRALVQDVLSAVDPGLTVETHVVERALSGLDSDKANLRQLLLDAERHVSQGVVSAWNRIFVDKTISDKRVEIDHGVDQESRVYVEFRLVDPAGLFAIRERSLGFRWFFVYLLVTTYRGQRVRTSSDVLFLFDEPASNLHLSAQAALLSSLGRLSEQASVIYTTHSHHLINPEWLGNTFVARNKGLDPTEIYTEFTSQRTDIVVDPYRTFAAHHPSQSQYFQPILDVLEYVPSNLEYVPNVVMVEGKNDYYVLSYMQFLLGRTGPNHVNLLPGGGAGALDSAIQLYLGWARPFVALLDSDEAGRRERGRYIEKFGPLVEPRLLDLASVAGSAQRVSIEGLLSAQDRVAIQVAVDPSASTYRKKAFHRAVQELLVTKQKVTMSAAGRRTMKVVLDQLAERLKLAVEEDVA